MHSRSAPIEPRPSSVLRTSYALAVGLALWSAAPLSAQTEAPAIPADSAEVPLITASVASSLEARLSHAWTDLRANPAQRRDGMAALVGTAKEAGLAGLPNYGRVLAAEGLTALAAGDTTVATTRVEDALELDPRSSDAVLARALVMGGGSRASTLLPALTAMRGRLTRLSSFPFALGNVLLVASLGFVLAGVLVAAAFAWSCQARIRHDVEERLKSRVSPAMAVVGGWVVLLLPLLLTFDLFWAALFWAFVVLAYLSWRDRVLLSFSLAGMALATPGVALVTQLLGVANQPYTSAAVSFLEGPVSPRQQQTLERIAAANPGSLEVQLLLGRIYERSGEPRAALALYNGALTTTPSAEVLTNIGNVHYRLEEKDRAVEFWKQALESDPNFAPAHYNLSQYYIDVFDFDKKNEHYAKAKEADPELINRPVGAIPGLVDSGVDSRLLWRQWWDGSPIEEPVAASLRTPPFVASALVLALGLVLAIRRGATGTARSCGKCGQPFCSSCKPAKERDDMCLQCVHLFQRKDGVSPRMRSEKMQEVESFQRRRRLVSMVTSLVAPGSGHLARGQGVFGWLMLTAFGFALAGAIFRGPWLCEPGFVGAASAAMIYWLAFPIALGVWLVANFTNLVAKAQR